MTIDWTGRSVAVTGATGMVGSWLTRELVDRGAIVTALIRDADPQSELIRSGTLARVSVVNGRLECYSDVERLIVQSEASVVFHLGAQTIVGAAQRSPRATLEANVQGTWNVLDAARVHMEPTTTAVVVASSDKAYGTQDLPYRESQPLEGRAPYEVSKSCTDLICTSYADTYGVSAVVARCGNIFGGGDLNWSRIVPGTIRSLLVGEQPILRSDGTFLRDYLHVDDIVYAYLLLADRGLGGALRGEAYNFSHERPMTVMEIYEAVCRAAERTGTDPFVLGRADGEIHDQYLDASKARDALGWTPRTSLDEGLRKTVEWYRDLLSGAIR